MQWRSTGTNPADGGADAQQQEARRWPRIGRRACRAGRVRTLADAGDKQLVEAVVAHAWPDGRNGRRRPADFGVIVVGLWRKEGFIGEEIAPGQLQERTCWCYGGANGLSPNSLRTAVAV
ncbi:MAG: hypothetical protein U1F18_06130 [Steroidobacteraceae bacterium]